ncbi:MULTISPECIES: hypothetical protein [unclassified Achromobacter]|uniref:hypothetical protein n=1 Tax=unclassified Achromobacter TaxID=2626865 RepID=UPI000B517785|nr:MULTISPECIES: hypothetical protein [unclassified Achromobacter]OWT80357.1 hypothetical protein CEY05_02820 [Achromobacter sp. HZ34]OWT82240.1 hypothetical protein CEY04_02820 [Achromobacter sp. HZ28]
MSMVKVTSEYGLVIRRRALQERGVSQAGLQTAMEGVNLLDENEDLISFGPCFGQETLDVLICRLSALGLSYFDDFVEVVADYPSWCQPAMSYAQPMKGGGE